MTLGQPAREVGEDHPQPRAGSASAASHWRCPNCHFAASAGFCAACGQSRAEWNISTRAWLGRALAEIFDLDGRFLQTLRSLIFQPGGLTQAWIHGRRASFVSPTRVYLLASAVLFGLLALPDLSTVGVDAVEGAISGLIASYPPDAEPPPAWLVEAAADESALQSIATSITDNLPRALFVLLPFGAMLLRFFVRRPRYHYVVHLIWTLHVHAVLFLLIAVLIPLNALRGTAKYAVAYPLAMAALIWTLWYAVTAFSKVYERSAVRSMARLSLVGMVYVPVFFLVVVLLSGLAG